MASGLSDSVLPANQKPVLNILIDTHRFKHQDLFDSQALHRPPGTEYELWSSRLKTDKYFLMSSPIMICCHYNHQAGIEQAMRYSMNKIFPEQMVTQFSGEYLCLQVLAPLKKIWSNSDFDEICLSYILKKTDPITTKFCTFQYSFPLQHSFVVGQMWEKI